MMTKHDLYRDYAASFQRLAAEAPYAEVAASHLVLAESWYQFSDQAHSRKSAGKIANANAADK